MPFLTAALSGGNLTNLRGKTYATTRSLAYCPNTTVFVCRPSSSVPTGVFGEFSYNTVTTGAYTDVKVGMKIFVTTTTSLRNPLWVGRIRKAPTSSILYVNEASISLQSSYYVTVVNDYDLFPKLPKVTSSVVYMDWDLAYLAPAPLVSGLQSSYVNTVASGSASFAFAPTGTATANGASISSWLWDVADGSITIGTTTTQNITASFPQGHRWVRVTVTDSNGVTNYFVFEVYVGTTYIIPNVLGLSPSAELDRGFNFTLEGWHSEEFTDVFRSLLDATRVTVFSQDYFEASTTPILTNIDMVGRLRKEDNTSEGDLESSNIQSASFEVEGFGTQLSRTSSQQFTFTQSTSPSAWGQVTNLNLTRAIVQFVTRFNTLSNICSIAFDDFSGNIAKAINIESTSAGEVLIQLAKYFNARIQHAPSGEIEIRKDAFLLPSASRGSLTTIVDLTEDDILSFKLSRDYVAPVGQAQVGASRYNTDGTETYFTGSAPPESQGNGEEIAKLDGLVLTAYSSNASSITELNGIVGAYFALSQQPEMMSVRLFDSWRNVLIPTCNQWYTFTLASTSNIRGLSFTSATRWQLQNVGQSYDVDTGQIELTAEFRKEPTATAAQIVSAIIPEITDEPYDPFPMFGGYSAFPPDPYLNYPTDTPSEDELQPFTPEDGYATRSTLPASQAARAANATPTPGCNAVDVFISNPANTPLGVTTTAAATYNVKTSGFGKINSGFWTATFDFTASDGGWTSATGGIDATYSAGVGWINLSFVSSGLNYVASQIKITDGSTFETTSATVVYDLTTGSSTGTPGTNGQATVYSPDTSTAYYFENPNTSGTNKSQSISFDEISNEVYILIRASVRNDATYGGGSVTIKSITLNGVGTAPTWATASSGDVYSDAYYYWQGDGTGAVVEHTTGGFTINGAKPLAVPAYSTTHSYTAQWISDGSNPNLLFYDTSYALNDNTPIQTQFCKV